jgi:protein phosphatase
MLGKMDCYGQSDVGRLRPDNQDQFLIADLNKAMRIHHTSLGLDSESTLFGNSQGVMLLVADGMGGHASGEQASRLAVESLTSSILNTMPWFFSRDAEGDEDLRHSLERALHR